MCVSDSAAFKDEAEHDKINCDLLKSLLLLSNRVPAICNIGMMVLLNVPALNEIAKNSSIEGGRES